MKDIMGQAFIFFLADFETSASSLTYAIFELAKHAEIQSKARFEINEILAKYQGELSYVPIMDMQYVDQVVSETLRKYPPLPRIVRHCTKNYKVPSTGLVIEKGTIVFIPTYPIQNDPDIYTNPEIFDPNRFDPEEVKKRHPLAFLGFGDGPRHCIGLRFGRMEDVLLIAKFLKHFEIKPCKQTPDRLRFNLNTELLSPIDDMYFEIIQLR